MPPRDKEVWDGGTLGDEQERAGANGGDGEDYGVRDEDRRGVRPAGASLSADVANCEAVWGRRCGGAGHRNPWGALAAGEIASCQAVSTPSAYAASRSPS